MYLSDRDIAWCIDRGTLIIKPPEGVEPPKVDPTSIDLRLDRVEEAKIWDIETIKSDKITEGVGEAELRIGKFKYADYSDRYLVSPPDERDAPEGARVLRRGNQEILVRPGGFVLWQTKEEIGTPSKNPQFICFVDGKSTRARTGIVVHLTAPTIHAGWVGNVVLEIVNLGPFTFVLRENDIIAQLTVATISSAPEKSHEQAGSSTHGQAHVTGATASPARKAPRSRRKGK